MRRLALACATQLGTACSSSSDVLPWQLFIGCTPLAPSLGWLRQSSLSPAHGLSSHPQTLKSTHAMGEAMAGATKAMAAMNRRMNLPAVAKIMREFEKQNERMEMTSEMMGDAGEACWEWGAACDAWPALAGDQRQRRLVPAGHQPGMQSGSGHGCRPGWISAAADACHVRGPPPDRLPSALPHLLGLPRPAPQSTACLRRAARKRRRMNWWGRCALPRAPMPPARQPAGGKGMVWVGMCTAAGRFAVLQGCVAGRGCRRWCTSSSQAIAGATQQPRRLRPWRVFQFPLCSAARSACPVCNSPTVAVRFPVLLCTPGRCLMKSVST